jgi:S-layer homology domain
MRKIHRFVVVSAFLLTLVSPTFAQTVSNSGALPAGDPAIQSDLSREKLSIAPETYGTSSLTYVSLSAWDFHPLDSATTYGVTGSGIYNAGGGQYFEAPLRLPAGAVVSYLELYGCNASMGLTVTSFFSGAKNDGTWPGVNGPILAAGSGCTTVSTTIAPVAVNNATNSYTVDLNFVTSSPDSSRSIRSFRVGYKLQISPDPGTATFTDVPVGSLYHRFVEALVAAGITGGCGGGNYCPDAPVTRGQIAVFLSAALGLHWAP